MSLLLQLLLLQSFNGLFSRTTWVSRYQKGRTNLDFTGARTVSGSGISLAICMSFFTLFFTGRMPFLPPNQRVKALKVLAWLSIWSAVWTCIWSSWCHCHSLSLASVKSRLVLPFWYRLTRVVPVKGPLNGCVYSERLAAVILLLQRKTSAFCSIEMCYLLSAMTLSTKGCNAASPL